MVMADIIKIIEIEGNDHEGLEFIRTLFKEYEQFLGVNLGFQDFEEELKKLPGKYSRPEGALLLAEVNGAPAGCAALRKHKADYCEMKRLYVKPEFRGNKLGRLLAEKLINIAQQLEYKYILLDTLANLTEAMNLYRSLGFRVRDAYYDNPLENVVYWEKEL